MYLAYTSLDDITDREKYELARDMALAAITGENIYNFGEVLATPILNSLSNTDADWLKVVVESLNRGDLVQFNKVYELHANEFSAGILKNSSSFIIEKATLLSLVNLAFERPSHDRIIQFVDIADKCLLPMEKVSTLNDNRFHRI